MSLHASVGSVHGPPWLQSETLQLLKFVFNADPDPVFHSYADPDPEPYKLRTEYWGSGSATLQATLVVGTADPVPQPCKLLLSAADPGPQLCKAASYY